MVAIFIFKESSIFKASTSLCYCRNLWSPYMNSCRIVFISWSQDIFTLISSSDINSPLYVSASSIFFHFWPLFAWKMQNEWMSSLRNTLVFVTYLTLNYFLLVMYLDTFCCQFFFFDPHPELLWITPNWLLGVACGIT